ncbi:MAG: alanine racemase [Candidatus Latescibacterota bacterium]
MQNIHRDTVAITDLSALRENYRRIQEYIGPAVRFMGVVKGNAYGHGLVECARTALESGAAMLGVAYAMEGVRLREEGIDAPILVLAGEGPEWVKEMVSHNLTMSLASFETLRELQKYLHAEQGRCRVHLKVDTGMGRVGIHPEEAERLLREAVDTPGVTVEGIYSHFPAADEDRDDYTRGQIRRFRGMLDDFAARKRRPPLAHLCNSAGILKFPEAHLDIVRPGIMAYGLLPYPGSEQALPLLPVLSWRSRVAFIKEVPAGFAVSYAGTFVTRRPSRLATVPVGYADGYRRFLSNRGKAIVNGMLVPVAGRVCMDQTVFDVTGAGDVRPGDPVILIGEQNGVRVSAEDLARIGETITHEIVTGIASRVSRAVIPAS